MTNKFKIGDRIYDVSDKRQRGYVTDVISGGDYRDDEWWYEIEWDLARTEDGVFERDIEKLDVVERLAELSKAARGNTQDRDRGSK